MILYRCSKNACRHLWGAETPPDSCPACGGHKLEALGVDDLSLEEARRKA